MSRACLGLATSGYAVPLISIAITASASGWFSLVNNALSDLGHATRSAVAPVFNLGLSLGAFLVAVFAAHYSYRLSKPITYALLVTAFSLNLISVFDEVYGRLHFWVSVAFFLGIAVLLVVYAVVFRNYLLPLVALALSIGSWIAHLSYGIPRGAAIPELISIFTALPIYIDYAKRTCRVSS